MGRGWEREGRGRDGEGGKEGEGWGGDSSTVHSTCVMEGPLCS